MPAPETSVGLDHGDEPRVSHAPMLCTSLCSSTLARLCHWFLVHKLVVTRHACVAVVIHACSSNSSIWSVDHAQAAQAAVAVVVCWWAFCRHHVEGNWEMSALGNQVPAMQINLHKCSAANSNNMMLELDAAMQACKL